MDAHHILISIVIIASYSTDPAQDLHLVYRKAAFIVFSDRPAFRIIEPNRANDATIDLRFGAFSDSSITKASNYAAPFHPAYDDTCNSMIQFVTG